MHHSLPLEEVSGRMGIYRQEPLQHRCWRGMANELVLLLPSTSLHAAENVIFEKIVPGSGFCFCSRIQGDRWLWKTCVFPNLLAAEEQDPGAP